MQASPQFLLMLLGLCGLLLDGLGHLLSNQPGALIWINFIPAFCISILASKRYPLIQALSCMLVLDLSANFLQGMVWQDSLRESGLNLLQILLGLPLVRYFAKEIEQSPKRLPLFAILVCCLPPFAGACVNALLHTDTNTLLRNWNAWFSGNCLGMLALLPLGLQIAKFGWQPVSRQIEPGILLPVVFSLSAIILITYANLPFPFVYAMAILVAAALWLSFVEVCILNFIFVAQSLLMMAFGLFVPPPMISYAQILVLFLPLFLVQIPPMLLAASLQQVKLRSMGEQTAQDEKMRIYEDLLRQQDVRRANLEQMAAILQYAADAIITCDSAGVIISFNQAAQSIYLCPEQDALGSNISMFVQGATLQDLLADKQARQHQRFDGALFPAELRISHFQPPLQGEDAAPHWILVVRDLTERLQADKLKSEFVATVNHELRTPLTSVIGSIGLLLGGAAGALSARQLQLLNMAGKNAERLSRLVNDLLDMQKMEAGMLALNPARYELKQLLHEACESHQSFALQSGVSLQLRATPAAHLWVDADRFQQIMANLISNACKFSDPGKEVVLSASLEGKCVRIAVQDHGCGISQEFTPYVFERFTQADSSSTRNKGGTGLGLAISRTLAQIMHGKLYFESTPGSGTCFFLELPLAAE
ncbi:ATP-binding protein [Massilia sp. W12]|uniref:ATP-binding protein n=1 Tax=Massilia sp. W12 TaxID=3126507 RepID=UPI0030D02AF7